MSKDKVYRGELGRKRNYWPRTGNLTVHLYASLFHSSTSAMHAARARKLREIKELADIQKEYQFLVQHCTRKSYQLQFAKWQQRFMESLP